MPDVRFATAADLPGLAAVEASGDALFETVFGPIDWPAPVSGESRAAEPGFLLVVGSPVVGFAHVLLLSGHWHLEQLVVSPAHGRRGLGSALLDSVCCGLRRYMAGFCRSSVAASKHAGKRALRVRLTFRKPILERNTSISAEPRSSRFGLKGRRGHRLLTPLSGASPGELRSRCALRGSRGTMDVRPGLSWHQHREVGPPPSFGPVAL